MNQAGAATPDEVTADCAADSDKLENCEFVDVQNKAEQPRTQRAGHQR